MSLRVYVYSQEELRRAFGLPFDNYECPSTLERTTNPANADCFFVSSKMEHIEMRNPKRIAGVLPLLSRLSHWAKHEPRHFFFMHGDEDRPIRTSAIVFRWSVNKHKKDPKTVTMPAPIREDLSETLPSLTYRGGLMYDTSFVGFSIDPRNIRKKCIEALRKSDKVISHLAPIDIHYGAYEGTEKGESRRKLFVEVMRQTRLPIAPRGAGQHSYRFVEALSAGRVPVLIADDWQLPFEKHIVYELCGFRIPENRAGAIDQEIVWILENNTISELADMARLGYQYWLDWLRPGKWPEIVAGYLKEML